MAQLHNIDLGMHFGCVGKSTMRPLTKLWTKIIIRLSKIDSLVLGGRKRWLQEGSGWQLWEEYGQDSGSLGKEEGDGSVGETRQQQMTTNMDSRLNNQTNKVEGEG